MIKAHWLQYYDDLPPPHEISYWLQSWDTAVKAKDINDYSVCTTWAMGKNGRFYLVDVFRKRLEYPELKKAVLVLRQQYRLQKLLIEDKASGSSLIQELKREAVPGVQGYEPPQGQDKMMRLYALTHLFEAGKVFLPKQAPWLHDYRSELTGFPGTKHDDQVDSTTQALDYLHNQHGAKLEVWRKLGRG